MLCPPVIFEDDALIALLKPAGLAVVSERGARGRHATLAGLVEARLGPAAVSVHRIDPEISGVVLFAKTKAAQDRLSGQFQAKAAVRVYEALVSLEATALHPKGAAQARTADGGLREAFTIELALIEDEVRLGQLRLARRGEGRPGTTICRRLADFGRFVWIEARPKENLLHQTRVHLAAAGVPVLNDACYAEGGEKLLLSQLKRGYKGRGEERPLIAELALHLRAIELKHPISGEPLTIEAPRLPTFDVALKYLNKFCSRSV